MQYNTMTMNMSALPSKGIQLHIIIVSMTTGSRPDYDNKQQVFNKKKANVAVDWRREGGMPVEPEACIPPTTER